MESTPNPNACKFCNRVTSFKCGTQDDADMCAYYNGIDIDSLFTYDNKRTK